MSCTAKVLRDHENICSRHGLHITDCVLRQNPHRRFGSSHFKTPVRTIAE